MEKKIIKSDLPNLKIGQLFLVDLPMLGEDVFVLSSKIKIHKYSITNSAGRKCMNKRDITNRLYSVFADEEGDTGDEMIWQWGFTGLGSLTIDQCDEIPNWNIRLIDKTHPKYDKKLAKSGKIFDKFLNLFDED
jgi:hypothetical protein